VVVVVIVIVVVVVVVVVVAAAAAATVITEHLPVTSLTNYAPVSYASIIQYCRRFDKSHSFFPCINFTLLHFFFYV